MENENLFLLHAFSMGVFITFVYDILRILRRVIPHGTFLVSLEDICFWIYCAIKVFLLMYREGNGTLRWFAVLGALAGMLLYRKLVSPPLVKYVSLVLRKVLEKIFFVMAKMGNFFLRPILRLFGKLRERVFRAAKHYAVRRRKRRELGGEGPKKKLTFLLRMFKMNL